jgi:ATP-dependent Clp protease, protease subunit
MSGSQQQPLSARFPGGCYLGFNAALDRRPVEQLVSVIGDSIKNGFTEINLCLSSAGGILDHTYYACSLLDALPVRLVTWNVGNIQSAAVMLFLCGAERYAVDGATFFFHQTGYEPSGRITEPFLVEKLKAVQYDDNRSASIIATKTGKPVQDVRGWQNSELVMNTTDAHAYGIIHGVRQFSVPGDAFFHQILV